MKISTLAAVVGLTSLCAVGAEASVVKVQASGTWDTNAPTTPYSKAGSTFAFSFDMPNPYSYVTGINGTNVPTTVPATELSSFQYSLGGVTLSTTISNVFAPLCTGSLKLCDVELFPDTQGGGLTLDFGDFSVDMYGYNNVSLGDQGTLKLGEYAFYPNINGVPSKVNGLYDEGVGLSYGSITAVPEPAAWAMLMFGAFSVGAVSRRARRTRTLATA